MMMIQRMFDAIKSHDGRLDRKRTGNHHAERRDCANKPVGSQSEQTNHSYGWKPTEDMLSRQRNMMLFP